MLYVPPSVALAIAETVVAPSMLWLLSGKIIVLILSRVVLLLLMMLTCLRRLRPNLLLVVLAADGQLLLPGGIRRTYRPCLVEGASSLVATGGAMDILSIAWRLTMHRGTTLALAFICVHLSIALKLSNNLNLIKFTIKQTKSRLKIDTFNINS